MYKNRSNPVYYILTNIISLDTVDFTECDPMLRITTLWFSESMSPLSETDDIVQMFFSIHNSWGIVTSFISHSTKSVPSTLSVSKWNLQILLLNINASFLCIKNDFQLNRPVILRIFSSKWELIATVSKLTFYRSIWWIEYTVKRLQKSVQGKIGKFMSKLCHALIRQNFALKLFKVKAFWKQIEKKWAFHWKNY